VKIDAIRNSTSLRSHACSLKSVLLLLMKLDRKSKSSSPEKTSKQARISSRRMRLQSSRSWSRPTATFRKPLLLSSTLRASHRSCSAAPRCKERRLSSGSHMDRRRSGLMSARLRKPPSAPLRPTLTITTRLSSCSRSKSRSSTSVWPTSSSSRASSPLLTSSSPGFSQSPSDSA